MFHISLVRAASVEGSCLKQDLESNKQKVDIYYLATGSAESLINGTKVCVYFRYCFFFVRLMVEVYCIPDILL